MDYELHLAGLEIEITRDCNLNCPHCMRYEPNEPMDAYRGTVIAPEVIDALFNAVTASLLAIVPLVITCICST